MKEQPMRWVLGSLMVLALAPPALAADLDILRGSQPIVPLTPVAAPVMTVGPATFTRWSGFYVGGDFSFNYSRGRLHLGNGAACGVELARHGGAATVSTISIAIARHKFR